MLIAIVDGLNNLVLFILVFDIRGRETRVDILRGLLVLRILPRLHARNVRFLERAVFVQGSADEVGTIRKVWGTWADFDRTWATMAMRSRFCLGRDAPS